MHVNYRFLQHFDSETSVSSDSDKRQTGPCILITAQSSDALHEDDRIIVPFSETPSPLFKSHWYLSFGRTWLSHTKQKLYQQFSWTIIVSKQTNDVFVDGWCPHHLPPSRSSTGIFSTPPWVSFPSLSSNQIVISCGGCCWPWQTTSRSPSSHWFPAHRITRR